jgi:hypothetical protein
MGLSVNVGGTCKNPTPYVNVGGVWKAVQNVFVNVGGVWKNIWQAFNGKVFLLGQPQQLTLTPHLGANTSSSIGYNSTSQTYDINANSVSVSGCGASNTPALTYFDTALFDITKFSTLHMAWTVENHNGDPWHYGRVSILNASDGTLMTWNVDYFSYTTNDGGCPPTTLDNPVNIDSINGMVKMRFQCDSGTNGTHMHISNVEFS